ncbi:transposase [Planctomycetales bacterium ZRK34]|nr:transposase [Planctomycetales bacterium ZRK34]
MMIAEAWSTRRNAQVRFLKLQLELMRQKLPGDRVILAPEDRQRLIRLGEALDHQVHDLIGIVNVKTYRRWLRDKKQGKAAGRVGRPRITKSVRELILRMARENAGWGVRRIVGELRKLALKPSRSSVRRVLVDEGLMPDPERHAPKGVQTPWRTFVKMHMNVMVACDFFCKTVWTPMGKRVAYCLMFIHLESRKVFVSPSTFNPTDSWVQQQGRNVKMWAGEQGIDLRYLLHDRDTKFTEAFDELFREGDGGVVKSPYQSPMANSFAESWIGSLKRECLNAFTCFGLRHLDYIVQTYVDYHNTVRPHQSLGNRPLTEVLEPVECPPDDPPPEVLATIHRERWLGGLLNHYYRKAA